MRGLAPECRVLPEGTYTLTLKAQVALVEGDMNELREELYLAVKATQDVIDALWGLDKMPTVNQVHQMFYKMLRARGFRSHHAKQIYKYALALVKAAKKSGGKKPQLRKLSVRLDKYDAKVDLESQTVTMKLRTRVFKIRLMHRREYIRKFIGRKWYEVTVSIDENGRLWVSIPFRFEYRPYKPRDIIAVDTNLKQVTIYDGKRVRRVKTRFTEALNLKHLAEDVQKRHRYAWRRNRKWLEIIKALHRRSRNIVVDWCRKFAKYIVLKARKTRRAVVLENLEKLWFNASRKSPTLADKLSRFAYRRLQQAIITKAVEHNVPVILVDPRNTSTLCPKCGSKLSYIHRLAVCSKCGLVADRDTIGAINIYLRAVRTSSSPPGSGSTHPMTDETRPKGGCLR